MSAICINAVLSVKPLNAVPPNITELLDVKIALSQPTTTELIDFTELLFPPIMELL